MGGVVSCLNTGSSGVFLNAAVHGDVEVVKAQLQEDPLFVLHKGVGGLRDTAWHLAAAYGHVNIIQGLYNSLQQNLQVVRKKLAKRFKIHNAEYVQDDIIRHYVVNLLNVKGQTPLMFACFAGKEDCVRLLMTLGADPWIVDRCGHRSALHYAALSGNSDCIRVIMSSLPPESHVMVRRSGLEVRLVDMPTVVGFSPLHYAAYSRRPDVCRTLLEYECSHAPVTSHEGVYDLVACADRSTPLHIAALIGNEVAAREILQYYWARRDTGMLRDPRTCTDRDSRLPFQNAVQRNFMSLAELLHPMCNLDLVFDQEQLEKLGATRLAVIAARVLQLSLLAMADTADELITQLPPLDLDGTSQAGGGRSGLSSRQSMNLKQMAAKRARGNANGGTLTRGHSTEAPYLGSFPALGVLEMNASGFLQGSSPTRGTSPMRGVSATRGASPVSSRDVPGRGVPPPLTAMTTLSPATSTLSNFQGYLDGSSPRPQVSGPGMGPSTVTYRRDVQNGVDGYSPTSNGRTQNSTMQESPGGGTQPAVVDYPALGAPLDVAGFSLRQPSIGASISVNAAADAAQNQPSIGVDSTAETWRLDRSSPGVDRAVYACPTLGSSGANAVFSARENGSIFAMHQQQRQRHPSSMGTTPNALSTISNVYASPGISHSRQLSGGISRGQSPPPVLDGASPRRSLVNGDIDSLAFLGSNPLEYVPVVGPNQGTATATTAPSHPRHAHTLVPTVTGGSNRSSLDVPYVASGTSNVTARPSRTQAGNSRWYGEHGTELSVNVGNQQPEQVLGVPVPNDTTVLVRSSTLLDRLRGLTRKGSRPIKDRDRGEGLGRNTLGQERQHLAASSIDGGSVRADDGLDIDFVAQPPGVAGGSPGRAANTKVSPFAGALSWGTKAMVASLPSATQCIICLDDVYALVLVPCLHRLCVPCARRVIMAIQDKPLGCPVCRQHVKGCYAPNDVRALEYAIDVA